MQLTDSILKLKGKIQHYDWGGLKFIPSILKISNDEQRPFAEYWMGAHKSASAQVEVAGQSKELYELIKQDPALFIGQNTLKQFGELPFLFKLLDVNGMLSIQVHPSKQEAVIGFEAEEKAGIPITASHRNYKDKNHKPEVMVALSDFWLLHGFKEQQLLQSTLEKIEEFSFLLPVFAGNNYMLLYKTVMELPQHEVNKVLRPLIDKTLHKENCTKDEPAYWVKKLYNNTKVENVDRGIFSVYFLNIVRLSPGEGIFQAAGVPHAYLEGQNVELMANSDNVLRGGLTTKHIAVPELMKHTIFEGIIPHVLKGDTTNNTEWSYPCPVEDFGLSALQLNKTQTYAFESFSAEIFIIICGKIAINNNEFTTGESFYVLPGTSYQIVAQSDCLLYKAFVPRRDLQ